MFHFLAFPVWKIKLKELCKMVEIRGPMEKYARNVESLVQKYKIHKVSVGEFQSHSNESWNAYKISKTHVTVFHIPETVHELAVVYEKRLQLKN